MGISIGTACERLNAARCSAAAVRCIAASEKRAGRKSGRRYYSFERKIQRHLSAL